MFRVVWRAPACMTLNSSGPSASPRDSASVGPHAHQHPGELALSPDVATPAATPAPIDVPAWVPTFRNAGGPPIFESRNPAIASRPHTPAARKPLINAPATTGAAWAALSATTGIAFWNASPAMRASRSNFSVLVSFGSLMISVTRSAALVSVGSIFVPMAMAVVSTTP